jgi:CBS domain containing-hemolysin-like protein
MSTPSETNRMPSWLPALRPGSHTYAATFLVVLAGTALGGWLGPLMAYAFGSGWGAPLLLALFAAFLVFLLRKVLFRRLYRYQPSGEDAALLEFFVLQNAVSSIEPDEEMSVELMENALQLKQLRAYDCMAPRLDIIHIDVAASVEELRSLFVESGLSRILVTDGELDQVLGYVHVQQLFNSPGTVRSMVMPVDFVPETIAVDELLQKLIRNRRSIAVVVDEYGSVAGIVTMEDALEQLFGDIDDEHDQQEFIESRVNDCEYLFSGRLRIDYLNEKYPALQLPEGDYQTLSGYLITAMQNIPQQGAKIELGGKTFVLELVSDRKIETVRVVLGKD